MAQINRKTSIWGKMVARVINGRLRKSQQSLINETYNPLFSVSGKEAQMIFDFARSGNYAQLQYLYNEIEKRDPTLLTCVTRRSAAISELDWKVVRSDERLTRKADKNLIQEQIECLETTIAKIENLPEALEHLGLFSFRGYSHISPVLNFDGSIKRFDLPDSWNFCFDRTNQKWLWNPDATSYTLPKEGSGKLQVIPSEELVSVVGNNAIDWPALFIFLRMAVGERDWGRFVETYGLPPVIITMPEFTSEQDQKNYMTAAEDVFEGKSGVIPFGSQVNYGSESRGTEPFSQFLEHQQKLIVLMATGGTLTSLAESGSGTLGGNAQMDVWKQIVRRDVRRISNAFNMQLCANVLKKKFKGKPILAEFQLDTTPKPTAEEILDLAGKAASAGFEMDENELSQATGYTIRKKKEDGGFGGGGGFDIPPSPTPPDDEPPPTGTDGGGANDGDGDDIDSQLKNLDAIATPKADVVNVDEGFADINENIAKTRSNAEHGTPIQSNKEGIAKADTPEKSRFTAQEKLARSLQTDFKQVADEISRILGLPEGERQAAVQQLLVNLDSLIPDDPVMAEVIAEQMMAAFGAQIKKDPQGLQPIANKTVANAAHECQREDKSKPCLSPDCPENGSRKNDGKISFHPNNVKSKELADEQCRGFGYKNVDDMMSMSVNVPQERVAAILEGNEIRCKPHEAVAVIRSGKTIPSGIQGEAPVKLTEFALRHYVCGERRENNTPKIEQLATFPLAVKAIRFPDSVAHTLRSKIVLPDATGSYPEGTQTHYRKQFRRSARMIVSAYTDKGVLSGWREIPV